MEVLVQIKEVNCVIKTKLFKEPFYNGELIDEQINDFLEDHDIEVVDIKLSRNSQNLCVALLIYKEKGE